jgi:hypothetical protein
MSKAYGLLRRSAGEVRGPARSVGGFPKDVDVTVYVH